MTNHWIDLKNADVILVMGSNPASNHPISMKWIMRAKEQGAKLIVVDPRFTQTATKADVYAPMRSGTDIAFLGGMIKYILDNNLIFKEYVIKYTNAPFLVNPDYKGPGELNGLFSGYDEKTRKYDKKTWSFQMDENGVPKKDPSLKDPNCVYQLLKKHYSRYTLDKVSSITGTPKEKLEEVYKLYASTGKPNRAGTELLRHGLDPAHRSAPRTSGPCPSSSCCSAIWAWQAAASMPCAERAMFRVRRTTVCYSIFSRVILPTPTASLVDLPAYIEKYTPKTKEPKSVNWWSNRAKYITSYLKAIYGSKATKENDFGYAWLPKLDEGMNASWLMIFDQMLQGEVRRVLCLGPESGLFRRQFEQDPAGARQTQMDGERQPLRQRDRLVLEGSRHEPEGYPDRGLPAALLHLPWKRKAVFRTPAGGPSGGIRPSIRSASPSPTRRS